MVTSENKKTLGTSHNSQLGGGEALDANAKKLTWSYVSTEVYVYILFLLLKKKNRHTWAIVSYNKVEDRERIEIPLSF